jgi:single-strand DNA-binding protein
MYDNTMITPVTITGTLSKEPEIRYSREGIPEGRITVAGDPTGASDAERTAFFDAVAEGDLAEDMALTLTKGMRVIVTGSLVQRSWQEDGDDTIHHSTEVKAVDVGPSLRHATADVQTTRTFRVNVLDGSVRAD